MGDESLRPPKGPRQAGRQAGRLLAEHSTPLVSFSFFPRRDWSARRPAVDSGIRLAAERGLGGRRERSRRGGHAVRPLWHDTLQAQRHGTMKRGSSVCLGGHGQALVFSGSLQVAPGLAPWLAQDAPIRSAAFVCKQRGKREPWTRRHCFSAALPPAQKDKSEHWQLAEYQVLALSRSGDLPSECAAEAPRRDWRRLAIWGQFLAPVSACPCFPMPMLDKTRTWREDCGGKGERVVGDNKRRQRRWFQPQSKRAGAL